MATRPFRALRVRIWADGTFEFHYPLVSWTGLETVGWFHSNGSLGELLPVTELQDGDVLRFSPIGELTGD